VTQYLMVIGCVRLTDISVIDTIRSYENREKIWGGLPPKWMCSGSGVLLKFWEISDNISETVKIETCLQWTSNRK